MKRILVTGSRDWTDWKKLDEGLRTVGKFGEDTVLVHGDAQGVDRMAAFLWMERGFPVEAHPADWKRHGKRAGYVRNQEMVDEGADACLAFIRNASRGATMCADLAEKAGIPVRRFEVND